MDPEHQGAPGAPDKDHQHLINSARYPASQANCDYCCAVCDQCDHNTDNIYLLLLRLRLCLGLAGLVNLRFRLQEQFRSNNQLNYSGLTAPLLSFHYGTPIVEEIPPTLSLPFISPLVPERTIFLRVVATVLCFYFQEDIVLQLRLIFQEEIWIIG